MATMVNWLTFHVSCVLTRSAVVARRPPGVFLARFPSVVYSIQRESSKQSATVAWIGSVVGDRAVTAG